MKNKEVYRHYGHKKFDINKFVKIKNRDWGNKPIGGLWACPTKDVDIDWKTWCKQNELKSWLGRSHFDFTLKDNARVFTIINETDLTKLPRINNYWPDPEEHLGIDLHIDFEAVCEQYDAIQVFMYRNLEMQPDGLLDGESMYYKLYGWDVDSILILNPDIIEEV